MHLVGFITRIYYDSRSSERQMGKVFVKCKKSYTPSVVIKLKSPKWRQHYDDCSSFM